MKDALVFHSKLNLPTKAACVEVDPQIILDLLKVSPGGEPCRLGTIRCTRDPIPLHAKAACVTVSDGGRLYIVFTDDSLPLVPPLSELTRFSPEYEIFRDITGNESFVPDNALTD